MEYHKFDKCCGRKRLTGDNSQVIVGVNPQSRDNDESRMGYDFERWSLALNMRNLGNRNYVANCSSGSCY